MCKQELENREDISGFQFAVQRLAFVSIDHVESRALQGVQRSLTWGEKETPREDAPPGRPPSLGRAQSKLGASGSRLPPQRPWWGRESGTSWSPERAGPPHMLSLGRPGPLREGGEGSPLRAPSGASCS